MRENEPANRIVLLWNDAMMLSAAKGVDLSLKRTGALLVEEAAVRPEVS